MEREIKLTLGLQVCCFLFVIVNLLVNLNMFDRCTGLQSKKPQQEQPVAPTLEHWTPVTLEAEVTAYTPFDDPNPWKDGLTATGRDAEFPGCATCWQIIPRGAVVLIPGAGAFVVDDTGGACRKAWREKQQVLIDIRLQNREKALKWGRQKRRVMVLVPEMPEWMKLGF